MLSWYAWYVDSNELALNSDAPHTNVAMLKRNYVIGKSILFTNFL